MANYRKQFNFRNGVQVDDDNFIVSPTGLVGIGTTVPTEALDVRGNAKVVGLASVNQLYTPDLTATSASITNLTLNNSVVGGGVSISSGIITASGAGVVTYYGDGGRLSNLPTSQWLDVDVGLGFTSIYAQGNVGVGTVDPRFIFQVSGNDDTSLVGFSSGLGISSEGNVLTTGIVTASKFVGVGSDLTGLNASSIAYGFISNDRIPVLLNSKLPTDISVSGVVTATGGFVGAVTGNVTGNLTGNVSGNVTGNLTGDVTGNVVGIASTARSLTGTPDIEVGSIVATSIDVDRIDGLTISGITTLPSTLHVGSGGTALSVYNFNVGIGSAIPTSSIQIQKELVADVEILSETTESKITLGQGVGAGNSSSIIRFGNATGALEILNRDIGNINMYLHAGNPGITTGRFDWIHGQSNEQIMSLTYEGKLGLGKTNPDHTLHVVGTSTVTSDSSVGGSLNVAGNLTVDGTINGTVSLPSVIDANVNATSGVSTFIELTTNRLGISTDSPFTDFDAKYSTALFGSVGIGTTALQSEILNVRQGTSLLGAVGIGTTELSVSSDFAQIQIYDQRIDLENSAVNVKGDGSIGFNTTTARSVFDYGNVGSATTVPVMIIPNINDATRNGIGQTPAGSMIFNTDTLKFQGYTGVAWTDFH